jgi:hypothetical protein
MILILLLVNIENNKIVYVKLKIINGKLLQFIVTKVMELRIFQWNLKAAKTNK